SFDCSAVGEPSLSYHWRIFIAISFSPHQQSWWFFVSKEPKKSGRTSRSPAGNGSVLAGTFPAEMEK
ncbi:MAG: hypothetical protein U0N08_07585, partial [Oscillospiraceae bacterium]